MGVDLIMLCCMVLDFGENWFVYLGCVVDGGWKWEVYLLFDLIMVNWLMV